MRGQHASSMLVVLVAIVLGSASCAFTCVDCASPPTPLGENSVAPFTNRIAGPGAAWWVLGRAEQWTMRSDAQEERALSVLAVTPSVTALAVPSDLERGVIWTIFADGVEAARADVGLEQTRSGVFVSAERLALTSLPPGTVKTCQSECFTEPFVDVKTTESPTVRWRVAFAREDRDSVAVDAWFLDDEDASNESAPRVLDTFPIFELSSLFSPASIDLETSTLSIHVSAADVGRPIGARLRSLADASAGPIVESR